MIIPTYNAAAFIHRALESLFTQTLQPTEILVIDDCSSDNTCHVIENFLQKYPTLRLYKLAQNAGPAAARNCGIDKAKGEWIAFLDADDAYAPTRLADLWKAATAHKLNLVTDNQTNYDSRTKAITDKTIFNPTQNIKPLTVEDYVNGSSFLPNWRELIGIGQHQHFPLMKWMVKRDLLNTHALRFDTQYRVSEDFHFGVRALTVAKAAIIPSAGYIYTESISAKTGKKSTTSKTVASFNQTLGSVNDLLQRFSAITHPELYHLLQRRKSSVLLYMQADTVKKYLHQKAWRAALLLSLQNPQLVWILLYKISKSLRHRFWRFIQS